MSLAMVVSMYFSAESGPVVNQRFVATKWEVLHYEDTLRAGHTAMAYSSFMLGVMEVVRSTRKCIRTWNRVSRMAGTWIGLYDR